MQHMPYNFLSALSSVVDNYYAQEALLLCIANYWDFDDVSHQRYKVLCSLRKVVDDIELITNQEYFDWYYEDEKS